MLTMFLRVRVDVDVQRGENSNSTIDSGRIEMYIFVIYYGGDTLRIMIIRLRVAEERLSIYTYGYLRFEMYKKLFKPLYPNIIPFKQNMNINEH